MSFYGGELQRYSSFKAYTTHGDVRQILVNDKGVIVLGARDIHMAMRRGPPLWHIQFVTLLAVVSGLSDRSAQARGNEGFKMHELHVKRPGGDTGRRFPG